MPQRHYTLQESHRWHISSFVPIPDSSSHASQHKGHKHRQTPVQNPNAAGLVLLWGAPSLWAVTGIHLALCPVMCRPCPAVYSETWIHRRWASWGQGLFTNVTIINSVAKVIWKIHDPASHSCPTALTGPVLALDGPILRGSSWLLPRGGMKLLGDLGFQNNLNSSRAVCIVQHRSSQPGNEYRVCILLTNVWATIRRRRSPRTVNHLSGGARLGKHKKQQ